MPGKDELPSTVQRSSDKAQRTWIKAHDSAVESYGEGPERSKVRLMDRLRSIGV